MGLFKKKAKRKKQAIPANSKLFTILRGIDEKQVFELRKMQGFETIIEKIPNAQKVELVKLKQNQK